jgi:hypothetical protein
LSVDATAITGGCLCGRIHYRVDAPPRVVSHCHCRLCQLASGGLFLTWAAGGISVPIVARR